MTLEDSLLSAAIINKERAEILTSELNEKHFSNYLQLQVFKNISKLVKSNQDVNLLSIINLLTESKKEEVKNYILYIMKELPFINFDQCIKIMKDNYNRKLLEYHAIDLVKSVKDNENISSIMDKLYQTYIDMSEPQSDNQKTISEYSEIGVKELFKDLRFVKTGINILDDAIYGFCGGNLVTIAARPRMGKSSLALQIADNMGEGCLFYGLEMKAEDNYARIVSSHTGIPVIRILTGKTTKEEDIKIAEYEKNLRSNKLKIIDDKREIRDIIIDIKNKAIRQQIKCVIIDYLQIIRCSEGFNRDTQIGIITKDLKSVAMQYNVPIIILAQLGRDYEKSDRKPILSDLRESGNIENDSDIVMFIHSEDDINKPIMNVDLIVAKGRNFGTGFIEMSFNKPKFKFEERALNVSFRDNYYE